MKKSSVSAEPGYRQCLPDPARRLNQRLLRRVDGNVGEQGDQGDPAVAAGPFGRVVRILAEATGLDPRVCADAAERAGGDCRIAMVSLLADVPVDTAKQALEQAAGGVREALAIAGLDRD